VNTAKEFEKLVLKDSRFEIVGLVRLGLVCFRLKGSNELSENLLKSITDEGLIYMVPGKINNVYFIRFSICAESTDYKHIEFAWNIIIKHTSK
jgi:hypothetical protein